MLFSDAPQPEFGRLISGRFQEGRSYFTRRSTGTSDWLLIFTVSGSGSFGHDNGELLAVAGDWVLARPNTPHAYGTSPGYNEWDLLWTHFHPWSHWLRWLRWPEAAPGLKSLRIADEETSTRAVEGFFEVHRIATSGAPRSELFALNALERVLLLCDLGLPQPRQAEWDPRIGRVVEYMRGHIAEPIDLPHLAGFANLSISQLSRIFKSQTGVSPQEYLERERITRASRLLEATSHSVQAISADVGYASPFYFSQRFKLMTGLSPSAYRARSHG